MVAPPAALKRLQSVPATPLHSQGNCRRACRTAHARASKSKLVPARPAPAPLCVSSIPKTSDQHGGTAWDLKRSSGPRPPAPGRIRPHTPRRGRSTGTHRRRSPDEFMGPHPAAARRGPCNMHRCHQMPQTRPPPAALPLPAGARAGVAPAAALIAGGRLAGAPRARPPPLHTVPARAAGPRAARCTGLAEGTVYADRKTWTGSGHRCSTAPAV